MIKIKNLNKFLHTDQDSSISVFGFDGQRINATDGYRMVSLNKDLFSDLPENLAPGQTITKSGVNFQPLVSYPNVQKILNAAKLSAHTGERMINTEQLKKDIKTLKDIQINCKQLMFFECGNFTEAHKYKNLLLDSQRGNAEIIDTQSITKPYSVTFQSGKIYTGYQIKQVTRYQEYGRKTIKKLEQYCHHTVKSEHVSTYCFQNSNATFNLEYLISILEIALQVLKADKNLSLKYYQSSEVSPLWFSLFADVMDDYSELLLMPIKP